MTEQEMVKLMSTAISNHGEIFEAIGEINKITAYYEPIMKKWSFFLSNHMPIVTDEETIKSVSNCVSEMGKWLDKILDYSENHQLDDQIRAIVLNYTNELILLLNDISRVYTTVVSKAFITKERPS